MGKVLDHRIEVRSTPGRGTVFSIEVPRGDASRDTTERAQTPRFEREDFRGTILVVEDETSVRSSLRRLLKTRGMEAIVVATANDALARISRQEIRPDLLICDYNLRGSANGVDTVNDLRAALGWNVPAIVMTGDIRSEVVDRVAAHGISVLIKPFSTDELLQHMAQLYKGSPPGNPTSMAG
jgi:CheY-like chemotaxis protein